MVLAFAGDSTMTTGFPWGAFADLLRGGAGDSRCPPAGAGISPTRGCLDWASGTREEGEPSPFPTLRGAFLLRGSGSGAAAASAPARGAPADVTTGAAGLASPAFLFGFFPAMSARIMSASASGCQGRPGQGEAGCLLAPIRKGKSQRRILIRARKISRAAHPRFTKTL